MPSFIEAIENASDLTVDDIKDVPPLPPGNYLVTIVGNYEKIKSDRTGTEGTQWTIRFLQPRDDVSEDALNAYLEATGKRLMDVTKKHSIWDSPYALSTLREFIRAFGVEGTLSVPAAVAELPGKQAIGTIINRPFTDDRTGKVRLRDEFSGFAIAD